MGESDLDYIFTNPEQRVDYDLPDDLLDECSDSSLSSGERADFSEVSDIYSDDGSQQGSNSDDSYHYGHSQCDEDEPVSGEGMDQVAEGLDVILLLDEEVGQNNQNVGNKDKYGGSGTGFE